MQYQKIQRSQRQAPIRCIAMSDSNSTPVDLPSIQKSRSNRYLMCDRYWENIFASTQLFEYLSGLKSGTTKTILFNALGKPVTVGQVCVSSSRGCKLCRLILRDRMEALKEVKNSATVHGVLDFYEGLVPRLAIRASLRFFSSEEESITAISFTIHGCKALSFRVEPLTSQVIYYILFQ
jgi:hypothetical protein